MRKMELRLTHLLHEHAPNQLASLSKARIMSRVRQIDWDDLMDIAGPPFSTKTRH